MTKVKYSRQAIQQLESEDYPFGEQGQERASFVEMFDPAYFDRLEPKYRRRKMVDRVIFSAKDYPPPQDALDLHGFTVREAERETVAFLSAAYRQGLKTVQIITGKGLHSPGGKAVLPDAVEQQLRLLKKQEELVAFRWEKGDKSKSGTLLVYL